MSAASGAVFGNKRVDVRHGPVGRGHLAVVIALKRQYSIVAHSDDVVELRHGTWNPGVVHAAGRLRRRSPARRPRPIALRSTPSGGALYPVCVHVVALGIDGLDRATYVYDPRADRLWENGDTASVDAVTGAAAQFAN